MNRPPILRCELCQWNIREGTRCKDRLNCGERHRARTPNQKAKAQGISNKAYEAKQLRKLKYIVPLGEREW